MPLSPGEQLGHYKVVSMLGKGGMGEVYLGTDTRLGRPVAIKVSAREFSDRFEREAQAISLLNHPNICTLYDVGPNYLVMELVEGESLAAIIGRGPLPLDQALQYAIQIVDALSAAHARGVIHRDLKPGNIIITKNGAKVLDFGLAKLASERVAASPTGNTETGVEPLTKSGAIIGTLYYMAPEQVEGKDTDERSDIFSFGVLFYEMITGQRPFTGDSQAAVLASLMKDAPPPIRQMSPRPLERLVRKCLEKKAEDRWQSARDLKPALELIDLDALPPSTTSASVSAPVPVQAPVQAPRRKWLWPRFGGDGVGPACRGRLYQPGRRHRPRGRRALRDQFRDLPRCHAHCYIARPAAGGPFKLYTRRLDQGSSADLSADGKRLVAIVPEQAAAAQVEHEIVFLQNFFDELRRRAPAGK